MAEPRGMGRDLSGASATVIGAGVSGLTSAWRLAEAGARVRVVAAAPPPRTVSAVAAAVWYPYRAYPEALVLGWARRSREVFEGLAALPASGVLLREGQERFRTPQPDPWWKDAVRGFRRTGDASWSFEAPVIDMGRYLPFLLDQLAARGVTPEIVPALRRLEDAPASDLLIHCAGLGARELAPDPTVLPIRGQVLRATNPGVTRFLIQDDHPAGMAYLIPRADDLILGGTADEGATSLDPDPATTAAILQRCAEVEPAAAAARVLEVKVGLRPGRPTIRLEVERRSSRTVVHNYGHGGAGVTVSWGCAEAVVELCKQSMHSPV